jgi:hypothetical protein
VYQVIRPSLVLVQTQAPDDTRRAGHGAGIGVAINDSGDILTSLHVVEDASYLQVAVADGPPAKVQIVVEQRDNDIGVPRASQPPVLLVPATLGNQNAVRIGDEAFAVGGHGHDLATLKPLLDGAELRRAGTGAVDHEVAHQTVLDSLFRCQSIAVEDIHRFRIPWEP